LLFSPLGENSINEAKKVRLRLHLPGQSIQPGEFFKIAYVFFITNWMIRKKAIFSELGFFIGSMLIILVCITIFVFLPDFGTILVLGTV
jgi:cell division protein FtsW (lipid II flippase)